MGERFNSATNH